MQAGSVWITPLVSKTVPVLLGRGVHMVQIGQ
uniref:Uncharacterized protein n=1 Tax=Siphoviridae sp. ctLmu1 TaxID=2826253 RepID=A0A8S5NG93_9CAUD|nr:MAG TPA: hypothetical protein [Siphoviridae sp. ctLmu1]DAY60794.1 MAG TPA: hypothetical protein [Caudoviricetes sp.]